MTPDALQMLRAFVCQEMEKTRKTVPTFGKEKRKKITILSRSQTCAAAVYNFWGTGPHGLTGGGNSNICMKKRDIL